MINELAIDKETTQMLRAEREEYMKEYAVLKARLKEGMGVSIRDGLRFGVGFAISALGVGVGYYIIVEIISKNL